MLAFLFVETTSMQWTRRQCIYALSACGISIPMHATTQLVQPRELRTVDAVVDQGSLGPMALYPNPILREPAAPVTKFGASLDHFGEMILASMKSDAVAASQYGVNARVIVLRNGSAGDDPNSPPLMLVNPRIVARSDEERMVLWREVCLVLPPELEIELLRDLWVQVEAVDAYGRPFSRRLTGEPARAFQHELDHLNGVLIIDHAALDELPAPIREREEPFHDLRQRRAFQRSLS